MRYRALGKTGLQVSEIGLSAYHGEETPNPQDDTTIANTVLLELLRQGFREGISLVEAARTPEHSEVLLERVLHKRQEDIVCATRLEPLDEAMTDDEMAKSLRRSIEQSRRTLKRETLDVVYLPQASDALLKRDVIPDILDQAQSREWIRVQGICPVQRAACERALEQDWWAVVQVPFTALLDSLVPLLPVFETTQTALVVEWPREMLLMVEGLRLCWSYPQVASVMIAPKTGCALAEVCEIQEYPVLVPEERDEIRDYLVRTIVPNVKKLGLSSRT